MRRPKDALLRLLVIHAAMMASVIGYAVVVFATTREAAASPPAIDERVFLALCGGVAAIAAAASFVLRARRLPRPGAEPVPYQRLLATLIASWGLDEVVAIAGLVPAFLYSDVGDYAPFGAAALILLSIHAPRPQRLAELIR